MGNSISNSKLKFQYLSSIPKHFKGNAGMLQIRLLSLECFTLSNPTMEIIVLQYLLYHIFPGVLPGLWKKYKVSFKKFFDFLTGDHLEEVYED